MMDSREGDRFEQLCDLLRSRGHVQPGTLAGVAAAVLFMLLLIARGQI